MSDSISEFTPKLIKYSNRPDIQNRVEEQEEIIEDQAPSTDRDKTNQDLVKLSQEARRNVASQIRLERERERKFKDKVTGLKNRLWFDQKLAEVARAAESKDNPNIAVIIYDIDKFKDFNSVYGHPGGDKVLGLLGKIFRKDEAVARYGGEEIAQIVGLDDVRTEAPLSDEDKIGAITDRTRTTLRLLSRGTIAGMEEIDHQADVAPKEVTMSFGVSKLQKGENPVACVQRASEGVLHAKNNGRNRGFFAQNNGTNTQFRQVGEKIA